MRRQQHGNQPSNRAAGETDETQFNLGYLYRTLENHIDTFTAQAGPAFTLADVADRMGQLLRLKAQTLRAQLGASELLLEMRQNGTAAGGRAGYRSGGEARAPLSGGAFDGGTLRPRLSAKAISRISKAQRLRWKKYKQAERARRGEGKLGRPRTNFAPAKPVSYTKVSKAQKGYWASKTPEERSREMTRRKQVALRKKAAKTAAPTKLKKHDMPRNFWLHEATKLLREPRPQREVYQLLAKRYPEKRSAIGVALATYKKKKLLVERDGLLALPNPATANGVNGAALTV